VPRPPQPITAIRILSEPAAKIRLVPDANAAAPSAAEDLIKSLRDKSGVVRISLFFIIYPFQLTVLAEVC
jgi:hypothetical protein